MSPRRRFPPLEHSKLLFLVSLISLGESLTLYGNARSFTPSSGPSTSSYISNAPLRRSTVYGTRSLSRQVASFKSTDFVSSTATLCFETPSDYLKGYSRSGTVNPSVYGIHQENVCRLLKLPIVTSVITMGKGDGKKKRKKKTTVETPLAPPQPAAPPPRRVTTNSLMSVKTQIQLVQRYKAASNSGTSFRQSNVKRTRYRKSWDEEEIETKRVERSKRGQEPDWDVILNRTASSPLLLIDGYNVIHKWPRLKKWLRNGQLSKARDTLVFDLEQLRLIKGWRIECVFDGAGKATAHGPLGSGPGSATVNARVTSEATISRKKVTNHGIRVVFSGAGESADSYISHRCFDAKKVTDGETTGSFIVASDDSMIRVAGANAGALCMSSGHLVDELKAVRKSIMHRVEVAVADANGQSVRPSAIIGTATKGRFSNKMVIVDKRKKENKLGDEDGDNG